MIVQPPGTILQQLYLNERVARLPPGSFVEVGVGSGQLSRMLLSRGWKGTGYDLNPGSLQQAARLNAAYIASGRFTLRHEDWLLAQEKEAADVVASSMVLEHLDDKQVSRYFERATASLRPGGRGILLVPGSPRHWGIEDVVHGHYRRYTADSLRTTVHAAGWHVDHLAGLCYPLSNILLRLSNALVGRAERGLQALTMQERTELSGAREVPWKTEFPSWAGVLCNDVVLRPFHWWQKLSSDVPDALVLYCECNPPSG